jgi:hypothetical protein
VKGVENMKKSTWIFVIGLVFLALTLNAVGQTGAVTVGADEATTNMQALKAGYVNSIPGAVWTGLVLTNSMASPGYVGMPTGGDTVGTVTLTCYKDSDGSMVTAETDVLAAGESVIVTFSQLFGNTEAWAGYCYAVSNFDALSGLAIVGSTTGDGWYGYQLTEEFDGLPVM